MEKLNEEKLQEFLNNAYELKEKDELTFIKIFYMLKGINMGQAINNKLQA